MAVIHHILNLISSVFKVVVENFGQAMVGFKMGVERGQREQAEAEAEILRKQRDIANSPDVANPLKAMHEFGKEDRDEKK